MLYFKVAGRTKYAREAPCFKADQYALLSSHEAFRQIWNRGFSTHGGQGNNIPLDLMLEHYNNYLKNMIHHHDANVSFKSAQTASRCANSLETILKNFDSCLSVKHESGHHVIASRKHDVAKVVQTVLENKLISKQSNGRSHSVFPYFPPSVLGTLDATKLWQWLQRSKKDFNRLHEINASGN